MGATPNDAETARGRPYQHDNTIDVMATESPYDEPGTFTVVDGISYADSCVCGWNPRRQDHTPVTLDHHKAWCPTYAAETAERRTVGREANE